MSETTNFLDFEKPIAEVERLLKEAKSKVEQGDRKYVTEVSKLQKKLDKVREEV